MTRLSVQIGATVTRPNLPVTGSQTPPPIQGGARGRLDSLSNSESLSGESPAQRDDDIYSGQASNEFGSRLAIDHLMERWIRLGPVAVRLLTNCHSVACDFDSIYRSQQATPDGRAFVVTVAVERRRSWRSLIAHYHITGEVDERFTVRSRARVVPHIEGMINLSVARHLPQYVQLHAAVLQRDEIGLVIPGGPGFGKTTLAAGLIQRGWNYASDEFALIDPTTIRLAPFPKSLSIKPGSVALLQQDGVDFSHVPVFHREDKGAIRSVLATQIRSDSLAGVVSPQLLIFPTLDPLATPSLTRIARGQAAMHCLRRCFDFPRWGPMAMETVAKMCERCDCYELTSGDLDQTCDLIDMAARRKQNDDSSAVNSETMAPSHGQHRDTTQATACAKC